MLCLGRTGTHQTFPLIENVPPWEGRAAALLSSGCVETGRGSSHLEAGSLFSIKQLVCQAVVVVESLGHEHDPVTPIIETQPKLSES